MEEKLCYFYTQKKERAVQRRPRKEIDDLVVFNKPETLLKFTGGLRDESTNTKDAARRGSQQHHDAPLQRRSSYYHDAETVNTHVDSSSTRGREGGRIQPDVKVYNPPKEEPEPQVDPLPEIDAKGPNLVAATTTEPSGKTKGRPSRSVRPTDVDVDGGDPSHPTFSFTEAKFASSSILSHIARYLYKVSEDFYVYIPVELVATLKAGFGDLSSDTVVGKREWQTDCYLELDGENANPFYTSVPEDKHEAQKGLSKVFERKKTEFSLPLIKKKKAWKKSVMQRSKASRANKVSTPTPSERPATARSVQSSMSYMSDVTELESEYDALPPGCPGVPPTSLYWRKEGPGGARGGKGFNEPRTRLEKFRAQKSIANGPGSSRKKSKCVYGNLCCKKWLSISLPPGLRNRWL